MKLNIINQSSNIELTSYQIAFMESVLEYSRAVELLTSRDFHNENMIFDKVIPTNNKLNIPIFLVNREDFKLLSANVYVPYGIFTDAVIDYTDEKIQISDEEFNTNKSILEDENEQSERKSNKNTFDIERDIEIKEREENEKKDLIKKINGYDRKKSNYNLHNTKATEFLGLYFSNYNKIETGKKQPAIFLNIELISKVTNNHNEFLYLTTKVFLHELAHHMLHNKYNKLNKDEYYFWMEESMANCLTLSLMYRILYSKSEKYSDMRFHYEAFLKNLGQHTINQFHELLDYSKEFIQNQPRAYQLGYYLFMYGQVRHYDFSRKWRNSKEHWYHIDTNSNLQMHQIVKGFKVNWLDYVKNHIHNDKGAKLFSNYNVLFQDW
jgi:hypothetical protein